MEYLRELNMASIVFRIFLAVLIGGVLGIERGKKNRPAGFRTYILVCLGATLVMLTNQYVYDRYGLGDPVRMGAQVISGIGFLGAGTIVMTGRNKVKGITTAACLWTAACSGLAIGIGFYEGAILCGVVIVFTMSGLQRFDNWMRQRSRYLDLYIEYNGGKGAFSEFLEYARENQFDVTNIQVSQEEFYHKDKGKQKTLSYTLTVVSNIKRTHAEMIDVLTKARGIQYIEEL
ncbi:MAG: MgtC/SapB family protein [Lachnospiraceae bacterium]|nr:MgtC/SapB family protein [Lachnospiraceae bacterium]